MLKKLLQNLKSFVTEQATIDPSQFNDPVALKTEWSPAKKGGTSFQTRELIAIAPYRVEFRATKLAIAFYGIFSVIGIGFSVAFFFPSFQSGQLVFNSDTVIFIIISVIFLVAGSLAFYFGTTPIVFDKTKSAFWIGRKRPEEVFAQQPSKNFVRLSDIHSLQIISEYVRGKNSYYSYELNIVRDDGSRVNVVDHGNIKKLKKDAKDLALFLNKSLWDTTSI